MTMSSQVRPGESQHPGAIRSGRARNIAAALDGVTMRLVASSTHGMRGLRRAPNIDVVLAVAAFAALLIDPLLLRKITHVTPLIVALALLTALPLVARRRFPLGVLAAVVPLLMVCLIVFHPNRAAVGIVMLLVFTVGLES